MISKIIWIILLLSTSYSCYSQADLLKLQPTAVKSKEIAESLSSYKQKAVDITSFLPDNYIINGTADYTKYIQAGIDENEVVLLPNFPIMVNDSGLHLRDNSVLIFNEKSKLILKPTSKGTYDIVNIQFANNVKVFNADIQGDIGRHIGDSGEWGMGIAIRSSSNVSLYNPKVEDCWGDGIYVGFVWDKAKKVLHDESRNIEIYNAFVNNNGRNGLSVVAVDNLIVSHSLFANNKRTFPKSGIDIEPGPKLTVNVLLDNNVTCYNGARGVDLYLTTIAKNIKNNTTVKIINHTDIQSPIGIRISGYSAEKKFYNIKGNIEIINPILKNNKIEAVLIEKNQNYMPDIYIQTADTKLMDKLNLYEVPRLQLKREKR